MRSKRYRGSIDQSGVILFNGVYARIIYSGYDLKRQEVVVHWKDTKKVDPEGFSSFEVVSEDVFREGAYTFEFGNGIECRTCRRKSRSESIDSVCPFCGCSILGRDSSYGEKSRWVWLSMLRFAMEMSSKALLFFTRRHYIFEQKARHAVEEIPDV